LTQELLPLAHRSKEPGDDVFYPHLQVQGSGPFLFSSPPSPGRIGDSPSLNKAILYHPIHVFCLDYSTRNARTKILWKQHLRITFVVSQPGAGGLDHLQATYMSLELFLRLACLKMKFRIKVVQRRTKCFRKKDQ
jgi:hypothetical protein